MSSKVLETGLKKFEIIAPLLSDDLEAAQKQRLRQDIAERYNISSRTLRRYLKNYRESGYSGLVKESRKDKGKSRVTSEAVLQEAVKLRKELPSRSARRILTILESENIITEGEISISTINRHFIKEGVTRSELKQAEPTRRFQKTGRNALWQADIKYGPFLLSLKGKKVRTFLMAILDDATRMPVHAEFYTDQKLPILEDSLRKALLKFGVPEAVYIDNGKIFISKWFRLACARLRIRHIATKPYSPQSKGKIERFNGFVNEFLEELSLQPPADLTELNRLFRIWLEEGYIHKPHSGLGGKTPYQAFQENPKKVRFTTSEVCAQVFLWEESRKVDKTGAVKLKGSIYDAGTDLINKKVELRFDPFDTTVVEVWHNGLFVRKVSELIVSEFLPQKNLPNADSEVKPEYSRLLAAYERMSANRDKQRNAAISFVDVVKKGGANHD